MASSSSCLICGKKSYRDDTGFRSINFKHGLTFDFCPTHYGLPKIIRDIMLERKYAYNTKNIEFCKNGPIISFENIPSSRFSKIPKSFTNWVAGYE